MDIANKVVNNMLKDERKAVKYSVSKEEKVTAYVRRKRKCKRGMRR